MKARIAVFLLVLGCFLLPVVHAGGPPPTTVEIHSQAVVAFSPRLGATDLILKAINSAQEQILVQAYSFTSTPILKALAKAKGRGVDVRVVLDHSNTDSNKYSGATYMVNAGVPVWIDHTAKIAHNKVMIFDHKAVLTGSFNFSKSAEESNAENVLYLANVPELAKVYEKNWYWRQGKSRPYAGR